MKFARSCGACTLGTVVAAVLWVTLMCGAHAQWKLESESPRVELGHGARQVTKKASGPAALEMSLILFEMKDVEPRIVAQTARHRHEGKTLAQLAGSFGAIAACNGGYFKNVLVILPK